MKRSMLVALVLACIGSCAVQTGECAPCNTSKQRSDCIPVKNTQCHSDKTTLIPRDINSMMYLEGDALHVFISHVFDKKNETILSATSFYRESTNARSLGTYFGSYDEGTGLVSDFIAVSADDLNMPLRPAQIIHNAENAGGSEINDPELHPLQGLFAFRPHQDMVGIQFLCKHYLDDWCPGLFFQVKAPIVHVTTRIGTCPDEAKCDPCGPPINVGVACPCDSGCDQVAKNCCTCFEVADRYQTVEGEQIGLTDYLRGNVVQRIDPNRQRALCRAKLGCTDSETVIGDFDLTFGYHYARSDVVNAALAALLVVPTSNTPMGQYLFEAVGGNGNHWALGATGELGYRYHVADDKECGIGLSARYQYLFKKTQKRTIGFNFRDGSFVPFGHYLLGGKRGQEELFPLANVLTRPVGVRPGSKIELQAQLHCQIRSFMFNCGYNFFFKDQEDVEVCSWVNNRYGVADPEYHTAPGKAFDPRGSDAINSGVAAGQSNAINPGDLCVGPAIGSSQLTHTVFGSFGCFIDSQAVPIVTSVGASYEWPDRATALEAWMIWGKISVLF